MLRVPPTAAHGEAVTSCEFELAVSLREKKCSQNLRFWGYPHAEREGYFEKVTASERDGDSEKVTVSECVCCSEIRQLLF
jgi:hypothetical protein